MNAPSAITLPEADQVSTSMEEYDLAKALVLHHAKSSPSWLQRQLCVGYNTAAKLIERMEADGIVSAPDHTGRRTVLAETTDSTRAEAIAVALHARGARLRTSGDGTTQLTIPVDLPTEHRAGDDRLRLLVERIERLEEEKKGIGDDIKDVYGELKAVGYDAKVTRQIVRLRKMRPDDRREMECILDTYKAALGLG